MGQCQSKKGNTPELLSIQQRFSTFLREQINVISLTVMNIKKSIKNIHVKMSNFSSISDLFVELKVCEWQLYSFSDFLLLDVHTTNVGIHHIWLLVCEQEHSEKEKVQLGCSNILSFTQDLQPFLTAWRKWQLWYFIWYGCLTMFNETTKITLWIQSSVALNRKKYSLQIRPQPSLLRSFLKYTWRQHHDAAVSFRREHIH